MGVLYAQPHRAQKMIRRSLRALALVPLLAAALTDQASADPGELGADNPAPSSANRSGPVLETPFDKLAAALRCHDAPHSSGGEPALLVHGISSTGPESWDWNYVPALNNVGIDVCTMDLPNILCATGSCVPALWQSSIGSNFLNALNADDETPGDVSYTSIYSLTDENTLLHPSVSEQGDGATNVPIQSICPARVVSHIQALADAVAYALVLDAFTHPGPADPSRIDCGVCGQLFLPGVTPDSFATHVGTFYATAVPYVAGITYPTVNREPQLRCYARP